MKRFNIPLMAEGLTTYAIERQNGFERHQQKGFPPWAERRRLWTDAILQGMARLEGQVPDPELMEHYDQDLKEARGLFFTTPATRDMQRDTILHLRVYLYTLAEAGGDRRRQVNMVWKLLDDMSSHLPWAGKDNGLDRALGEAEYALCRMTAQLPICFTRVLLGGDAGPHWVSGFVSGSVTDAEAVRRTAVYRDALRQYPEVKEWPALCTVCVGRDFPSAIGTVPACAFDLEIMNRIGDGFLKEQGVQQVYARQMILSASPAKARDQNEQNPLLQGSRPLGLDELKVYECYSSEGDGLTFCLDVLADEEAVFGRQLSSKQEGSRVMAYAVYDEGTGQARDALDVELRLPHDEKWFRYELSPEMRESLRRKMDTFYVLSFGEHLPAPPSQSQEESAPLRLGPTM